RSMVLLPPRRTGASHLSAPKNTFAFTGAFSGFVTRMLAHMLDSLVRVSRRVDRDLFADIPNSLMDSSLEGSLADQASEKVTKTPPQLPSSHHSTTRQTDVDPSPGPSRNAEEPQDDLPVSSFSLSTISSTFHSLFKVLFIFPSRYLFAIGLSPVFSLRWNLPPALGCIPEQPDSTARLAVTDRHPNQASTGLSPSAVPRSRGLPACDGHPTSRALRLQFQTAVRPSGF
ncbi:Regulator of rDNA transcription protein 15, partial [Balamuthia mandrillaris]